MTDLNFDETTGILTYRSSGFLTLDDVEEQTQRLGAMAEMVRGRIGRVRVLVIGDEMKVQSAEVAAKTAEIGKALRIVRNPQDRLAIFTPSVLVKMQNDRILSSGQSRTFSSLEAARDWLREDDTGSGQERLRA